MIPRRGRWVLYAVVVVFTAICFSTLCRLAWRSRPSGPATAMMIFPASGAYKWLLLPRESNQTGIPCVGLKLMVTSGEPPLLELQLDTDKKRLRFVLWLGENEEEGEVALEEESVANLMGRAGVAPGDPGIRAEIRELVSVLREIEKDGIGDDLHLRHFRTEPVVGK